VENLDDRIWTLLADDRFIKWVAAPDEVTILYWEKWMEDHPEERAGLLKAREIARDLAYAVKPAGAEDLAAAIWAGIKEDTGAVTEIKILSQRRRRWPYWAAAGILFLVLAGASITYFRPAAPISQPALPQSIATVLRKDDLERQNQTASNQQVYLVDGSKVILQPGARIRHAAFLQKDRREVFLEGNAFFEVAKDAARPFYVYTGDLVVHVLGTRFNVTRKDNGDITVLVHSGKVSVSRKANPAQSPLILEPNHLAQYNEQTHDLVQSFLQKIPKDLSVIRIPSAPAIAFDFEEAPVTEIFATLESAYGIPLHYDRKNFSGCRITTSLGDETFEEKLKIICAAIGATYRITGDSVSLDGKPCKE